MEKVPQHFVPQPFAYHEEVDLRIDALSNEGEGVGRIDGRVVFVPFTLPGERVRARIYRNDRNCSWADLIDVQEISLNRVQPVCPVYGICGGCCYQHVRYEEQLAWKRRQVVDLMRLQAGIETPVNDPVSTSQVYAYRSKITPHFNKPRDAKIGSIGFLRVGSRSELCDISRCPIAMDPINELLPALRRQVQESAAQYRRGATLLLRVSEDVVLTNPRAVCCQQVGNITFRFLAGDFFQNNPFILPVFTEYVAQQACGSGAHFLVDAYCGSGLFSLCLASRFEKVVGVEVSETGADWARFNAESNGIRNAHFLAASAEAIFSQVDFPPAETAVIIDPPRKGCDKAFLDQLFAFGPSRVVYVSCNPATQVRDLVAFREAGYRVLAVQPFDLFPQTKHLECVTTLDQTS